MKKQTASTNHQGHMLLIIAATIISLLVPLIAMQLSNEVQWAVGDFVAMGALVFVAATSYELISRKLHNTLSRVVTAVTIGFMYAVVWAELAVGIFS